MRVELKTSRLGKNYTQPKQIISSDVQTSWKMSGFTGFSDADIRKVHNGQQLSAEQSKNKRSTKKVVSRKKMNEDSSRKKVLEKRILEMKVTEVPVEATEDKTDNIVTEQIAEVSSKKSVDLEEFQARQKLMEELNRQRKEILTKALADRTKRTLQEQQRLNEIQAEFKRLDADLSNDVKILRKQIEIASMEYMEAQKQYNKAEREFLDAKLYLHQRHEKKDLLTEHLCTIIEKNEERKASKLNELLQKLDMSGFQEDVQSSEVTTSEEAK